ncbi:hypothetical protein Tco_1552648, partial [Tanacetum coccineum]
RLRAEVSKCEAVEKSLRDETDALKECNAILKKEQNALDMKVADLEASVVGKERGVTDLNSFITFVKSQNDILAGQMALHLEEKFYPHLLTTISCRSKAIKKGMQDGLFVGITHGKEGRVLADSNEDASIKTVMDILRLEEPLAEILGLNKLQPTVDELMVLIHHSPNKVVIGATALSLALDVSSVRPFSTAALKSTEGTDGPEDAQGSGQSEVASFPYIVEFEKEELDTTSERDPPS